MLSQLRQVINVSGKRAQKTMTMSAKPASVPARRINVRHSNRAVAGRGERVFKVSLLQLVDY